MKIIKTQAGKTYYVFGAHYKDPIKDYIDIRQPFKNVRIYSREISYEVEVSLKRIFIFFGVLCLLVLGFSAFA